MAASMQVAGVPLRELLARIEKASGRRIGTSEAELLGGFTECDVQPWRPPPIRAGERRKTCPVCAFSWLDRWKKDECPKCLNSLSHSSRLASGGGARRVPGEVSTFKQPPSSAMEYLSGQCKWGGAHLWRFGRCSKCGLAEGSRRGVVDSSYAPLRLSNSAADSSSGAHSGALGRSSSTPALRPAPPVLAWGAGPLATPESAAAGPILESEMVNQCDAAGQDWELLLTTRNGAAEHAISRLQPTSLPNSHARLTRPSSVQSLGAPSWRGAPIRRPMKSSQLGLDQVYRKPDVGETRRECPVCAFRWLDKYGKDEVTLPRRAR